MYLLAIKVNRVSHFTFYLSFVFIFFIYCAIGLLIFARVFAPSRALLGGGYTAGWGGDQPGFNDQAVINVDPPCRWSI